MSVLSSEFMRPLVNGWIEKIESAAKHRAKWDEIASECMMFYARSAAAMWDMHYARKFWRGGMSPRFRITINKAFELVAIFGPSLLWDVPHRNVNPKKPIDLPPELFGDIEQDPMSQQLFQMAQMEAKQRAAQDTALASMLSTWLNYTAGESPGGGLAGQSELAVLDALIKGRGVLRIRPYSFPASERTLTGAFRVPPEDLYIDPDFNTLDEAKWIAIKRREAWWEAERRFGLKQGTLRDRATLESMGAYDERKSDSWSDIDRRANKTNDIIEYYEIWSKTGPGTRLSGMETVVKNHLEDVVGDYAYIVVSKSVPFPLNLPTEGLRKGAKDDEVRRRMSWSIPFWTDAKWPISVLDFYPDPEHSWPIAPLAPALGELKFLNTFIGHLCNRIWSSSRNFWAVDRSACSEIKKYLESGDDQAIIELNETHGGIDKVVQILEQPEINMDAWRIVELVADMFDKRTGLVDFLYAANSDNSQNRTAEESKNKRYAAGIRPEYMQKKVVTWQSEVAAMEAMAARWFVTDKDVEPLFGKVGAMFWGQLVMSSDVEAVTRQMQYTVAASSIRRPNRDKEQEDAQNALNLFLPFIAQYSLATSDFAPFNGMMEMWGETVDADLTKVFLSQEMPDPNAGKAEEAQAKMQIEQQKLGMEMEKTKLETQSEMALKQMEMQAKQQEMQMDMQKMQMDIAGKQAEMQVKLQGQQMQLDFDRQRHTQEMGQDQQRHSQELQQAEQQGQQQLKLGEQEAKVKQKQTEEMGRAKVEQTRAMGDEKAKAAKKQAAAKPKPTKKPKT